MYLAFAEFKTPSDTLDIHLTEVIQPNDPSAGDPRMVSAIQDEAKDLLRRGMFKVILKEEIPQGADVLNVRYVLAIKSSIDCKIKFKTRYVIGGHRDMLKRDFVHNAHTLHPTSVCLMIALAAALGFKVWSTDIKLA